MGRTGSGTEGVEVLWDIIQDRERSNPRGFSIPYIFFNIVANTVIRAVLLEVCGM